MGIMEIFSLIYLKFKNIILCFFGINQLRIIFTLLNEAEAGSAGEQSRYGGTGYARINSIR